MTRFTPLWLQAGDYAASVDRRLVGALWPASRCDGCAVGITGLNDMAVAVQPGYVSVPTPNNTGSTLCVSDAIETVPLDAAPPPGQDRIDLIVAAAHGGDLDTLADGWAFEKVTGVVSVPPAVEPAVPAGATLLARVNITGGMVAVDAAHIIDRRPYSLAVPGPAAAPPPQIKYGYAIGYGASGSPNAAHPAKTMSGRAQVTTDAAGRCVLDLAAAYAANGITPVPVVTVAFHAMAIGVSLQCTSDTPYPWTVNKAPLRFFSVTGVAYAGTFNILYTSVFQNGAT